VEPLVFGGYFGEALRVLPAHDTVGSLHWDGVAAFLAHGTLGWATALALAGLALAWFLYLHRPELPARIRDRTRALYLLLLNKYYLDEINDFLFARGVRRLGQWLWRVGDVRVIDGVAVNGTARLVGWLSGVVRYWQSGYLYWYAFMMIA